MAEGRGGCGNLRGKRKKYSTNEGTISGYWSAKEKRNNGDDGERKKNDGRPRGEGRKREKGEEERGREERERKRKR